MNVVLLCHSSLSTQLMENYYKYYSGKFIHFSNMEFSVISSMLSIDWIKDNKIDLVATIGNSYQKSIFLQDMMQKCSIPFFMPSKGASHLEQSKITTKKILDKLNIPTAKYSIVKGVDIQDTKRPFVVKYDADHLLGKQTEIVLDDFLPRPEFHDQQVLVEEFLEGEEFSYQVVCNGSTFVFLGISKDNKRYMGYNTCGIAATSKEIQKNIPEIDSYVQKILNFLSTINISYKGVMYLNVMKVNNTYYVLEINTRFGEPETQSLYPTLKCDLFKLFYNSATSKQMTQIERTGNAGACIQLIHKNYDETRKEECIFPKIQWSEDITFGSQLQWSKNNVFGSLTASGKTSNIAIKKIYDYLENKYLGDFTYNKNLMEYHENT
jgi:phosphoribosylamine--glycine ligase